MIVDDEAPLLRAMQRLLGKTFDVVSASGTEAALAAFREGVRVVLTDFSMPDGNGLALARSLRERGFTGPVAVLSAVAEDDELRAALSRGDVDALICKPWGSAELIARVAALCDRDAGVPVSPAG
jgi:DNA-binding response OmpR family regulator